MDFTEGVGISKPPNNACTRCLSFQLLMSSDLASERFFAQGWNRNLITQNSHSRYDFADTKFGTGKCLMRTRPQPLCVVAFM